MTTLPDATPRVDRELYLGDSTLARPPRRYQILALSGGGYRGLFSALILEELEAQAERPLREVFNLLTGTSIGGILAGALAEGVPAAELRAGIERHGPRIFDSRVRLGSWRFPFSNPLRKWFAAKYSLRPLDEAIVEMVGEECNRPLAEVTVPLLIPAVSHTSGGVKLFHSEGVAVGRATEATLKEAMMATAAAPTFFPPFRAASEYLVDGGLVANAPELLALTEAIRWQGLSIDHVHVLSVGTASPSLADRPQDPGRPGLLNWAARGLFQLTLKAEEELSVRQCGTLLRERYVRIDCTPTAGQAAGLGLDRTDPVATETLKFLAAKAKRQLTSEARLSPFLHHAV